MRWLDLAFLLMAAQSGIGQSGIGTSSIGVATMTPDGVITLRLRAEDKGMVGEGLLTYRPGEAQYDAVVRHLGGLKPGESKPVAPWTDK